MSLSTQYCTFWRKYCPLNCIVSGKIRITTFCTFTTRLCQWVQTLMQYLPFLCSVAFLIAIISAKRMNIDCLIRNKTALIGSVIIMMLARISDFISLDRAYIYLQPRTSSTSCLIVQCKCM